MVTAVITTYKRPPEILERAIKSVLSQTCADLELIVVDDSPADFPLRPAVRETVEEYTDRNVRYIPHEKNMGACAARNTGLEAARGDFIGFLDDDDEWLPEKLEKQLHAFEAYGPDTGLIYCGRMVHNDTTGQEHEAKVLFKDGWVFDTLIERNFVGSTSYPLMRTAALKEVGGFDVQMPASQDMDAWLRIAQKYKVGFVAEPLAMYHIHEGECITANPMKKLSACLKINEKYADYLQGHPHARWIRHHMTAKYCSAAGQYGRALANWCKAVAIRPTAVGDNLLRLRYAAASAKLRKKG